MELKRCLAKWLASIVMWLDPEGEYELVENYKATQLGIGYHITKADVRKFRKEHPEYTSHRKGLDALIEDTKDVILGNIVAGIKQACLVEYKVKKTMWTADITGSLKLYIPESLANGIKEADQVTKETECQY